MSTAKFHLIIGAQISANELFKHLFENNNSFRNVTEENFKDTPSSATWDQFCEFISLDFPENKVSKQWTNQQFIDMNDFYEQEDVDICYYRWKLKSGKLIPIVENTFHDIQSFIAGEIIDLSGTFGEVPQEIEQVKKRLVDEGLDDIKLFVVNRTCHCEIHP